MNMVNIVYELKITLLDYAQQPFQPSWGDYGGGSGGECGTLL
jgi:hypothetical protein